MRAQTCETIALVVIASIIVAALVVYAMVEVVYELYFGWL